MTSYQENTTKQPIECLMLTPDRGTTHMHDDKHRNRFLKQTGKITSYRILIKCKRKQAHPDTTTIAKQQLY